MPRDGSLTFSDLIASSPPCKLTTLRVECDKCERKGRYSVTRLIEQHGRDGKLTDWLAAIAADCPKKRSVDMSDQCGVHCPDLSRVM